MVHNFRSSRADRVLEVVRADTEANIASDHPQKNWIHAGTIGEALHIDRANVSRELNRLYKDGQLIKVQGKPTLFICRSALEEKYPGVFFPSTLPKDTLLQDFVASEKKAAVRLSAQPSATDLETQVGSIGTLRSVVQQAKAAVLYPPNGLNVLITGHVGVGKLELARKMYAHAIAKGRLAEGAPFITVNCREYPGSPQTFLSQLFGYSGSTSRNEKSRRGLIERASGGILCLQGVERLSPFIQDNLFDLLERGTYTRVGEASSIRKANVMVIAIADELLGAASIQGLQQRVPVRMQIPDLDSWSPTEALELVAQNFHSEAVTTGLSFQVHSDVLSCFLKSSFPGNLGGLSSAVRTSCSLAYLDAPEARITNVSIDHLPGEFMQDVPANAQRDSELRSLLLELGLEAITFTPDGYFTNRDTGPQFLDELHRISRNQLHRDPAAGTAAAIPIVLLSYGEEIAERTAAYVNSALETDLVSGLSFSPDMNLAQYTDKLCALASQVNQGAGVLLIADMEPLTSLHISLRHLTGLEAETCPNASMPTLILAAQLSAQRKFGLHELNHQLSTNQINQANPQSPTFLNRTVDEILTPLLTFINPTKAAEVLTVTLDNIVTALDIRRTDEIAIKFIFHSAHMLERLIRGNSLRYDKLKTFINQYPKLFSILEKQMQYPAEVFGITIPASELAYVAEIFIPESDHFLP